MADLIRYRNDIEWPLNEDGQAKLLDEGVMQSPTIYDGRTHHVDPETLHPFGGSRDAQLMEVLDVMQRRVAVRNPKQKHAIPCFEQGEIFKSFGVLTPEQGAEKVRADDPAWHPTHARQWLHNNGVGLLPVFTANPMQDFTNGPLPVAAVMDALPHAVSPTAFSVKYYHGLARPKQVIERALTEQVEVPSWFTDTLAEMGVTADNFDKWFQYNHPPHPDYIAMHAAVAAFGYVAALFFLCSASQIANLKEYMEEVAHNRDTGGVHTWSASHDGLYRVGIPAVKAELPKLVKFFGGSVDVIEARMAEIDPYFDICA